jgi:8-oxo-dGTP pyrophosphatase MutT (NUDIX family)
MSSYSNNIIMGGGLLPVAIKNNKPYFLFGLENELDDTPGWADFGGGKEDGETTLDTAIREGGEEINGFLGTGDKLRTRVKKNRIATISYKTYSTYIFKIDYDEKLPYYYKNNYEFFSRYLPHVKHKKDNGLLEKAKIRWFSFKELKKEKGDFRSFYQNIVDLIIKREEKIIEILKKSGAFKNKETKKKNKKIYKKSMKRSIIKKNMKRGGVGLNDKKISSEENSPRSVTETTSRTGSPNKLMPPRPLTLMLPTETPQTSQQIYEGIRNRQNKVNILKAEQNKNDGKYMDTSTDKFIPISDIDGKNNKKRNLPPRFIENNPITKRASPGIAFDIISKNTKMNNLVSPEQIDKLMDKPNPTQNDINLIKANVSSGMFIKYMNGLKRIKIKQLLSQKKPLDNKERLFLEQTAPHELEHRDYEESGLTFGGSKKKLGGKRHIRKSKKVKKSKKSKKQIKKTTRKNKK